MAFTNLLEIVYPVGTIYFSSISTSPAEIIGGTWTQITDGRFWRPTDSYGVTGGQDTVTLTKDNIPGGFWNTYNDGYYDVNGNKYNSEVFNSAFNPGQNLGIGVRGRADSTLPVSTAPSYRTCYCWVRIS